MTSQQTFDLSVTGNEGAAAPDRRKMKEPFGRIDGDDKLREQLLPYCRLSHGEKWEDPISGHVVAVVDSTKREEVADAIGGVKLDACITDPPYNVIVGAKNTKALGKLTNKAYEDFTAGWLDSILPAMQENSTLYVWLGADVKNGFFPVPEFCIEMRGRSNWVPRNWITVRNQRGYGTQKNWMWVRQELLYYVKGAPVFNVDAEYTDIPKILRGYYKDVGGKRTENVERGKRDTIRAGNVWVDIQQVFYRLKENVPGCYAQKPFKSIKRLVDSCSDEGGVVVDPFSHSGTTLLACEETGRRCFTFDIDPVFAEISIRRLEHYRKTGELGWQCQNPFPEIRDYAESNS